MNDFVFFYPEGHQAHVEPGHPERPERVEAMVAGLQQHSCKGSGWIPWVRRRAGREIPGKRC